MHQDRHRRRAGGARHRDRLGALRQHPVTTELTSDPGAKDDGIPATVLTPPRQLQSLATPDAVIVETIVNATSARAASAVPGRHTASDLAGQPLTSDNRSLRVSL